MESQESRFIRKFMSMLGTRKARVLDYQSTERIQRQMPQGQKDLGIYPEENNSEEIDLSYYKARGTLNDLDLNSSIIKTNLNGIHYLLINEDQSGVIFPDGYVVATASDNLTFTDCIFLGQVSSTGYTLVFDEEGYDTVDTFPATYINCEFDYMKVALPNCNFIRCDLSMFGYELVSYYQSGILDEETFIAYVEYTLSNYHMTDCLVFDYRDFL